MGRSRKNFSKKHIYDKFYLTFDVYKHKVAYFKIRFDYQTDSEEIQNTTKGLKNKLETLFKKEFEYLERSRHIFEVEMADEMSTKTARCSLNGYFLIFDDYEEFVLQHAHELMKNIETLFNQMELNIILPTNKNKYTKTY